MEPLYVHNPNEMNGNSSDSSEVCDENLFNKAYDKAINRAKDLTKSVASKNSDSSKKREKVAWKKGDFCRAIYLDGIEYEAEILNISKNQCVIRYCGYGNEESMNLKDLMLSKGERARSQQEMEANKCKNSNACVIDTPQFKMGLPGIPPPPPPHIMKDCNVDESEALSAMLMSWYMSGYHTGFYQGLTQSKKDNS